MKAAVFDLETDGLLDQVSKVHVMVVKDLETGQKRRFRQHQMTEGLAYLDTFPILIAHNGIKFDMPVLAKLYGYRRGWAVMRDTLVLSRLMWADIVVWDMELRKKQTTFFPAHCTGSYSLEAWGRRMGNHKGDFKGPWDAWTQEMEDYCDQDVEVTADLWQRICDEEWAEESVLLETQVAHILARQERYGFLFDQPAAVSLYGTLVQRKMVLERELKEVFKPRFLRAGKALTPARDLPRMGYTAGAPMSKVKLVEFNPGSRDHIASWLKAMRGWKPTEFTADGSPKVDETVIAKLPYPEAAPLKEYLMVDKRIGQIAEGKEAWLKAVQSDGRIHGGVNTMGTVTGRMSHSRPNMGQVPASHSPYGPECRALFIVGPGKVLVGCDADALELRDLAGYMSCYDSGAYIEAVLKGDKKAGTDVHSMNARALGLDPRATYFDGESGRDIAKTWFYAFIYGAGDEKLGTILLRVKGPKARARGKAAREDFLANLPGMGALVKAVKAKAKAKAQKWLKGLDGRRISVRSDHAALNTLLQSAGAVQMKRGLCILDDDLQAAGLTPGIHYEFVANVHDEWQIEVDHDRAEVVGRMAADAIRKAGEYYNFRCPLAGDWKQGRSWLDTH
jgi:DNA polymerase I